ncbi:hypothetical protein [Saccharopolyspora rosea]|uniref:Uncharacterized protein n=1 Tax=Saccharopolyspora rosea TaxID=524884 RepID=A0ABW3FT10_9PSEU|nr:hypothetical protein [Saccharopolyspora rosea]
MAGAVAFTAVKLAAYLFYLGVRSLRELRRAPGAVPAPARTSGSRGAGVGFVALTLTADLWWPFSPVGWPPAPGVGAASRWPAGRR